MSPIGRVTRGAAAALLLWMLGACAVLPWGAQSSGDDCSLTPVSRVSPFLGLWTPALVSALCGVDVEVNGEAVYGVSAGHGFTVDERDLQPFGTVTASSDGRSGEVFALDGVDPEAMLALESDTHPSGYEPIFVLGRGAARDAFPDACRYFRDPTTAHDTCE